MQKLIEVEDQRLRQRQHAVAQSQFTDGDCRHQLTEQVKRSAGEFDVDRETVDRRDEMIDDVEEVLEESEEHEARIEPKRQICLVVPSGDTALFLYYNIFYNFCYGSENAFLCTSGVVLR